MQRVAISRAAVFSLLLVVGIAGYAQHGQGGQRLRRPKTRRAKARREKARRAKTGSRAWATGKTPAGTRAAAPFRQPAEADAVQGGSRAGAARSRSTAAAYRPAHAGVAGIGAQPSEPAAHARAPSIRPQPAAIPASQPAGAQCASATRSPVAPRTERLATTSRASVGIRASHLGTTRRLPRLPYSRRPFSRILWAGTWLPGQRFALSGGGRIPALPVQRILGERLGPVAGILGRQL